MEPVQEKANTEVNKTAKRKERRQSKSVPLSKKSRNEANEIAPVYILENGLRKVEPYYYNHHTYAKQRWLGRTLYNVFSTEFNDKAPGFYKKAIEDGSITVNGMKQSVDYIICNSDLIENKTHRHEPPVTDSKIGIVFEDDELVIIDKPGSIPVHPTGRYRHNTCQHILKYEMGYQSLNFVNRIDRLTSGLVILAKTKEATAKMTKQIRERDVKKVYFARVKGEFKYETYECNAKIETVSHKVGVNVVSESGKDCCTFFEFVSFNGITSLVKCYPKTGRTHQIRVHLQYLGYPIANDPVYNNSAWGENVSKGGIDTKNTKELINSVTKKIFAKEDDVDKFDGCVGCSGTRKDPKPENLSIYLHSFRYETEGWSYETPLPAWAVDGWNGDTDIDERFWKHGGLWDGEAVGEWEEN